MNPKKTSGSPAVETACPKTCSSLARLASPARTFRHSQNARVNLQEGPKQAAEALRTFPSISSAPLRRSSATSSPWGRGLGEGVLPFPRQALLQIKNRKFEIVNVYSTPDFPTQNEFPRLNFNMKGTL